MKGGKETENRRRKGRMRKREGKEAKRGDRIETEVEEGNREVE